MEEYDPLNYDNLAKSVVEALFKEPEQALELLEPFAGSGVYAIYYHGDFPGYAPLVKAVDGSPIYVGKAVPSGARKGKRSLSPGKELYGRLKEHAESIEQAKNLQLRDFTCRYLVVVPVWITLAERFLVERYQPVWNVAIDGFGNHDPGSGRKDMKRPRWDILHPGRPWAVKLKAEESFEKVLQRLQQFLRHKSAEAT
jgi:hypothetical protein